MQAHVHENRERAAQPTSRRPLAIVLAINVAFRVGEIGGGALTNSLALLAVAVAAPAGRPLIVETGLVPSDQRADARCSGGAERG